MTRDPDRTDTLVPASIDDSVLEAGLAAAFGETPAERGWSQASSPSVDPSSDTSRPDPGRYQLFGEIAQGGMGVILKGRDEELCRDLAVKVLKPELVASPSARQRFLAEARVTGQLQHPGVVPIYDLGYFVDGRPFFAMKWVKGRTLADHPII
jgi:serine/threonine protein kinase